MGMLSRVSTEDTIAMTRACLLAREAADTGQHDLLRDHDRSIGHKLGHWR